MENNLLKRLISGVVSAVFTVLIVREGGSALILTLLIGLCLMLFEWYTMNKGKLKTLLFTSGIVYITIPVFFWIYEAFSDATYFDIPYNIYIMWVLAVVWSCDIFAYFGGKAIGGPKFAPKISPNKTWSGVVVGGLSAFVVSWIYNYYLLNNNSDFIYFSVVIIFASVLGDLLESKVKRVLKVKDSGNVLPGHGGICDRLDSFLLASYAFMAIKFLFLCK